MQKYGEINQPDINTLKYRFKSRWGLKNYSLDQLSSINFTGNSKNGQDG